MSRWAIDEHRISVAMALVRPLGAEERTDRGEAASADPGAGEGGAGAHGGGLGEWDDDAASGALDDRDEPGPLDELFARAIWSVLVEPGDSVAGVLIRRVGAVTAAQLVLDRAPARVLSEATAGEISADDASSGLKRWTERLRATDVLRSLESAGRCGARMVVPGDPHWPDEAVAALGDSPPVLLWAKGDLELLRRPGVAIVGARAATGYGEHVAMEFAAGLGARDVVVVSGGAYGIDGMAHRAALASGGATIAVLAGGIDRLYPSGHEALLTRVAEQGLLLSEVPCGTPPTKWRFLQRNRLIAALSTATVVVEAGRRSGALNTSRHALGMGRPVGIVPGPITSAASAGCHATLRAEPATCVTSVAEVMQLAFEADGVLDIPMAIELDEGGADDGSSAGRSADPLVTRVIDALRPRRGQTVDELARAVGESAERIRSVLGRLDLDGEAARGVDGLWRRVAIAAGSTSAESAS